MVTQVVEVLNPLVRDQKSVDTMRAELSSLQAELSKAHSQVLVSPPPLSFFCNLTLEPFLP